MQPISITYLSESRILELKYKDGAQIHLNVEFLRVFSPSAEVRGHSPEQRVLQSGKKHVRIQSIDPVGNYAIRIVFDDGHDTGIYSWSYLKELSDKKDEYWEQYLQDLDHANASRLPKIQLGHRQPSD